MENFLKKYLTKEYAILASIVSAVALLGIVELPVPPGRDQGIFLYHGWGLIEGLVPYRDLWDHKPPGIYFLYAAALKIFGHRYVSINIFDILWRLATVAAVYSLARKIYGKREGYIAAIIYGIWATAAGSGFWWTAQAESFMVLPLVLSMHFFLIEAMTAHALCGIMAAFSTTLKTTAGLMILFYVAAIYIMPRKTWEPFPKRSKFLGYLFGILMVFIPLTMYFAFSYAADDLWNTVITFNLYHGGVTFPIAKFFENFKFLFLFFIPLWAVVWIQGIAKAQERKNHLGIITLWLLICILMVFLQRKYFLYHYFMIIGPGAVLAARGFGIAIDYCFAKGSAAKRIAAAAAMAAWVVLIGCGWLHYVYQATAQHYRSFEFLSGAIDKTTYFGRFIDPAGDVSLIEDKAVAAYIRDRTKPDEKFLVWGFEPLVNFWAQRFAPTRFNSDYPLSFEPDSPVSARLREKWRGDFMNDIGKNAPAYIAVVHNDRNALETVDSAAQLEKFPEFKQFIAEKYSLETTIKDFDLYRRR